MDYVITTRELAKWAKEEGIDFSNLEDGKYDEFMGDASGAGVIFGNTGGVMEAALRTAYEFITKERKYYYVNPEFYTRYMERTASQLSQPGVHCSCTL